MHLNYAQAYGKQWIEKQAALNQTLLQLINTTSIVAQFSKANGNKMQSILERRTEQANAAAQPKADKK